jgi:hypothetical protein
MRGEFPISSGILSATAIESGRRTEDSAGVSLAAGSVLFSVEGSAGDTADVEKLVSSADADNRDGQRAICSSSSRGAAFQAAVSFS